MMSGHGANTIFFNKKNDDWMSRTLANPRAPDELMMNSFCGMIDRRKAFRLISSQDHCQRFSPSRISDTPRAGFEAVQNLS